MHRLAHEVSGGLIVALPGPDEDHNPATAATLAEVLRANPDIPYDKRIEVARFMEDLTASYQGGWYSLISLHGGGSPAALKQEIWRNYPGRRQGRSGRTSARPRRAGGRKSFDHAQTGSPAAAATPAAASPVRR
jgi:aromatic ring hydroxylase